MTNQDKTFIQFKNVTKKFGDFTALDNVSLDIPKGVFLTLLGPSGCGKTTLLRQLAGFSDPEAGDVLIAGKRVNGLPPYKRNTPLVFQEYALFPHMTVQDNITYGLKLQKVPKEQRVQKLNDMLKLFNLEGLEDRYPRQLSGGQQQRVAFARALIMNEEILLLDEPLSNLDAKLRVEVRDNLREIQQSRNITALYVTHDQDEALSMSDMIAVMKKGKIEQLGSPYEVYFRPVNQFVADFVGVVNFLNVEVIASNSSSVSLKYRDTIIEIPNRVTVQNGETVVIMLRPEAIHIHQSSGVNQIKGKIIGHSFLGSIVRYHIQCGDDILTLDEPNPDIKGPVEGIVNLSIDTEKIHILKQ